MENILPFINCIFTAICLWKFIVVGNRWRARKLKVRAAFIAIYLGVLFLLLLYMGLVGASMLFMLFVVLLTDAIGIIVCIQQLKYRIWMINTSWFALFIIYALMILLITLGIRDTRSERVIQLIPFHALLLAIRTGNVYMFLHFLDNGGMFLPLGILFTCSIKKGLPSLINALVIGGMLSVTVETLQLYFNLGQCDMDDIIANTAGMVIGTVVGIELRHVAYEIIDV